MGQKRYTPVGWLVGLVIGIIGFWLAFRYLAIQTPLIATKFTLAPAWLTGIAAMFGPVISGLVAFGGHALSDGMSGNVWWTWAISDGLYGILLGLTASRLQVGNGQFTAQKLRFFTIWQILANLVVWVIIAPLGDWAIYGQSLRGSFDQGVVAALSNIISTATVGTLILVGINKFIVSRVKRLMNK